MSVPYGQPPVTYVPGRWTALVADQVALLAELPAASAVLGSCWTAMVDHAGVDAVLAALTGADADAAPVENFVLVGPAVVGGTTLVVGGTGSAEVHGPKDGPITITSADGATRHERVPDNPRSVSSAGPATPTVRSSRSTGGVVLAAAIGLGTPAGAPTPVAAAPADAPAAVADPVVAASPAATPPAASPQAAPAAVSGAPGPVGPPAPVGPSGTASLPAVVSPAATASPPATASLPTPTGTPEPTGTPAAADVSEPVSPPTPAPTPARVSGDTMPPRDFDSGLIDSLPWRTPDSFGEPPADPVPVEPVAAPVDPGPAPTPSWGDPQAAELDPFAHNPWAGAAPPAWPDPNPAEQPAWPTPGTPPGGNWGEPAAVQPGWPAPSSDSNPWAPGGAGEQPSSDTPAAPVVDAGGPAVHAFACPQQHLNPPYAGNCRICGEPIPPQEGFSAPRPQLGVLTLSTGDTVPLDRDVVLGRAPFHADENAASRPHLVQLSSPGNDISRSHVRVNLENWFVQVTDLGSTNGTVVTLPDQAPVRLRPHDPFTILPGTTVNIADEVTLRFDAS